MQRPSGLRKAALIREKALQLSECFQLRDIRDTFLRERDPD
jgi:hypothetical protein